MGMCKSAWYQMPLFDHIFPYPNDENNPRSKKRAVMPLYYPTSKITTTEKWNGERKSKKKKKVIIESPQISCIISEFP